MAAIQQHIIKRQVLEMHLSSQEGVKELQDYGSRLFKERVLPEIDRILSEFCAPDELIRIDKLEVDLEPLTIEEMEHGLPEQVQHRLREMLIKKIYRARTGADRQGISIRKLNDLQAEQMVQRSALESLVYYLQTGISPWWDTGSIFDFETLLLTAWQESSVALARETGALFRNKPSRHRLISLIRESDLIELLDMAMPNVTPLIRQIRARVENLDGWSELKRLAGDRMAVIASLDFAIVAALYSVTPVSQENEVEPAFLAYLQEHFPNYFPIQEDKLEKKLEGKNDTRLSNSQRKEAEDEPMIPSDNTELLPGKGPETKNLKNAESTKSGIESDEKSPVGTEKEQVPNVEKTVNPAEETKEQLNNNKSHAARSAASRELKAIDLSSQGKDKEKQDSPDSSYPKFSETGKIEEITSSQSQEQLNQETALPSKEVKSKENPGEYPQVKHKELMDDPDADVFNGKEPENQADLEDQNNSHLPEHWRLPTSRYRFDLEKAVEEGLVISNSGLVLLGPYLLPFFDGMGLLEEKKFRDAAARQRAVQLLHYLYSGAESGDERHMPLNKLLCGMRINDFVTPEFRLTEVEKAECDNLLEAVVHNWSALKGGSVEGFRRTFLQKQGILGKEQHGWLLRIQRSSIDILLERLPWSIAVVRMPWNNYLIHVEW